MRTLAIACLLAAGCGSRGAAKEIDAGPPPPLVMEPASTEPLDALPFYRSAFGRSILFLPERFVGADATRLWEDIAGYPMLRIAVGDERAIVIPWVPAAQWPPSQVEKLRLDSGPEALAEIVVDGDGAAIFVVTGQPDDVRADLDWLVAHTRVGNQVPHLKDRGPQVRLTGWYRDEDRFVFDDVDMTRWLHFDPRGYASSESPVHPAADDVEALVQWATLVPSVYVWTYHAFDGNLYINSILPPGNSLGFVVEGETLVHEWMGMEGQDMRDIYVPVASGEL